MLNYHDDVYAKLMLKNINVMFIQFTFVRDVKIKNIL